MTRVMTRVETGGVAWVVRWNVLDGSVHVKIPSTAGRATDSGPRLWSVVSTARRPRRSRFGVSRSYEIRRIVLRDDVESLQTLAEPLRGTCGLPYDLAGPLASHVGRLDLVGPFPHLAQAHGAVESVKNR